ncbi:MAG TPA: CPBP family intramembrane glutamic endopeptidase [Bacteroidota bacterium]
MTLPALPEDNLSTGMKITPFIERKGIHPILFAFLSLAVIFVLYQIGGGLITFFVMHGAKIDRENVGVIRLFTMLGQIFLIFVPTVVLARLLSIRHGDIFPLRAPGWRESAFAVIGLLSLQRIFEVYIYFQDSVALPESLRKLIDPIRQMLEEMVKVLVQSQSIPELLFVILVVAFVPSIVEEFLFRGLIQSAFGRAMKPLASAILAGMIFGLFHLNPFEAVPLMAIGCFLGFLRYRSASMVLPVLMHFLNNLLAIIAEKMNVGDEKIIMAPSSDHPGLAILLAQLLLFGGLFIVSTRFYIQTTDHLVERHA